MLKRVATLLLLTGLLALPARAMADYNGPKPPKSTINDAYVRVHNAVDDAVLVTLGFQNAVLESGEVRTFLYSLSGQKATAEITASLVSDPSVSATASVELQKDKTVEVTVVYAGGTLSLEMQRPAKAAGKN